MNLNEAKEILNKNGFKLLKESVVTVPCVLDKKLVYLNIYGHDYYAKDVHATSKMTICDDEFIDINEDELKYTVGEYTDCDGNPMSEDREFREALRYALINREHLSWKPMNRNEAKEILNKNGFKLLNVSRKDKALNENATFHKGVLKLRVGDKTYTASDVWAHGDISNDETGIGQTFYTLEDVYDMEVADGWYDENGNEVEETEEMRNALSDYIDNADIDEWDFDEF